MIEYENLKKANEKLFSDYEQCFHDFLRTGWYILGNQVEKFEREFAEYCHSEYCVGVASGLDALVITLDSLNFPAGYEIIVPANTYIATILAIIKNNLKPVLVEPDINTYNIDATKIEERITDKTCAILVVHLYGKACDMSKIMSVAHQYNLQVIEDVAQAHGAMHKGKKTGSFGIGCFSFYPTKNLGALGDAGAITCDDFVLSENLRALRNYGSGKKYQNDYIGYNSRLDEIQAGFLSIKLTILDKINAHKRKLAKIYLSELSPEFIKPVVDDQYYDVYHIFNIRHSKRDRLKQYLLENNVITEVHYPIAPHKQKCMQGIIKGHYPISQEIHDTTLSLPISYCHDEDDVLQVCYLMNQWIKKG